MFRYKVADAILDFLFGFMAVVFPVFMVVMLLHVAGVL